MLRLSPQWRFLRRDFSLRLDIGLQLLIDSQHCISLPLLLQPIPRHVWPHERFDRLGQADVLHFFQVDVLLPRSPESALSSIVLLLALDVLPRCVYA